MRNLFIFLIVSFFVFSCEGKRGPVGPGGPGSRIVYEGEMLSDVFSVTVPELDVDEMPSLSVYVSGDNENWLAVPCFCLCGQYETFVAYGVSDGALTLFGDGCAFELYYKIVIVI